MATKQAQKKEVKSKPEVKKLDYTTSRKIQELEDRISTCETVLENDFSEQLGLLIERRTEAMAKIEQYQDRIERNKRYMGYTFAFAGVLIIASIIVNTISTPQFRYVRH